MTVVDLTLVDVDPTTDPRWDRLHADGGSLFTSPSWLGAVVATYDFAARARLAVASDGTAVAGIAYAIVDDLRGRRAVSFPFSDYQEPLGEPGAAAAVMASLVDDGPIRFRLPQADRPAGFADDRLEEQCDLLLHAIDIDPGLDDEARFAGLASNVRQNIRRSRRAGVESTIGSGLDDVLAFYDLHVTTRLRKHRLLPQPVRFFEAIHEAFAPDGRLAVALARLDGRPIAGVLYLESRGRLFYKFNASIPDDLGVRPNEQLVWEGIRHAASRGLRAIDLGVSDLDQPGLIRYKQKLSDHEQHVVTLTRPGDPTVATQHTGALLRDLSGLFVDERVPDDVARRAGELLYRYFV